MPKLHLYFFLLLIFTITACFSDEDPLFTPAERSLPAITTEGLNTFGCYIAGELFGPLDSPGFAQDPIDAVYWTNGSGLFQATCTEFNNENGSLEFISIVNSFFEEGTYEMPYINGCYIDFNSSEGTLYYGIDTLSPSSLEILRFDQEQAIVSGTFYFTAIAEDYSDTIKVTDGRFDVIVTY